MNWRYSVVFAEKNATVSNFLHYLHRIDFLQQKLPEPGKNEELARLSAGQHKNTDRTYTPDNLLSVTEIYPNSFTNHQSESEIPVRNISPPTCALLSR